MSMSEKKIVPSTTMQEKLVSMTNNLAMSGELLSNAFFYAQRLADFRTPATQVGMNVFVDDGFILALEIGNEVKGEITNKILHALFCSGLKVTALHRSSRTEGYTAHRHEFLVEKRD